MFDDIYLDYRAKPNLCLLNKKNLEEANLFIKKSSLSMSKFELQSYQFNLEHYKYAYFARVKDKIVGVILFTDLESEVLINHLYVDPLYRFKGIGSVLIKGVMSLMQGKVLTYLDISNNLMPWMDSLKAEKKLLLMKKLGSFWKANKIYHQEKEDWALPHSEKENYLIQ
ncbi:MAG: GNAT family N-acetyltransferase [Legionella sp.]|nr:GNAT family N-acetyltransferase [Legionella sp.]